MNNREREATKTENNTKKPVPCGFFFGRSYDGSVKEMNDREFSAQLKVRASEGERTHPKYDDDGESEICYLWSERCALCTQVTREMMSNGGTLRELDSNFYDSEKLFRNYLKQIEKNTNILRLVVISFYYETELQSADWNCFYNFFQWENIRDWKIA